MRRAAVWLVVWEEQMSKDEQGLVIIIIFVYHRTTRKRSTGQGVFPCQGWSLVNLNEMSGGKDPATIAAPSASDPLE